MADDTQSGAPPSADEPEPNISFAAFVISLAHTAAVHFGDVADPMTGQADEPNLPAAKQMIDILTLLEQKTRGNLAEDEGQLLEQILYELRLRFLDAARAGFAPPDEPRIIIP